MADSLFKDALDALGEMGEWMIPNALAERMARATNNSEIAAVIRDVIAGVPGILDWPLHLIAQRLHTRGTTASRIAGALLDLVPPLATEVRQRAGITDEQARAETAHRFMEKYASIRSTLPTPGGSVPDPTTPATPAPVPVSSVSRIQQNIGKATGNGAFTQEERLVLVYMFRVLRIEGSPGSDIVAELEGEARSGKRGLLDTIKENSADIKEMFSTIGGDFSMAYSSFEAMRDLERDGDVTSANRAAWREAAANFVRRLMPVYEFLLMGHAERYPDSTTAAAAMDVLDRLNMFAGLEPSTAFQRARDIQQTVVWVGRGLLAVFGLTLLYFLLVVQWASSNPETLGQFAWWSTWIIIGGSAATTIFGAFTGRTRVALLGASTAFALAPIVLTVVWVVAVVFTPVPDWRGFWMALIVVVGLDFITFSLTQKFVQTIGGIPAFLLSFFPNKEEAKAAAEKLGKHNFLANISSTIAGAIVLLWLPIVFAYIFTAPSWMRVGGIAVIAVAACAYGYLKRSATMKDYKHYGDPKVADQIKKHDIANLDMAYSFLKGSTIAVLIAFIVVWFTNGGVDELMSGKRAASQDVSRIAGISQSNIDSTLSKAEGSTRNGGSTAQQQAPTRSNGKMVDCGSSGLKSAEAVAKRKASLGGKPLKGTENNYPWNCDD